MAQQGQALVTKPHDLSLIPGTHTQTLSSDLHIRACHVYVHTYTHKQTCNEILLWLTLSGFILVYCLGVWPLVTCSKETVTHAS